jgi:hypothetical protein
LTLLIKYRINITLIIKYDTEANNTSVCVFACNKQCLLIIRNWLLSYYAFSAFVYICLRLISCQMQRVIFFFFCIKIVQCNDYLKINTYFGTDTSPHEHLLVSFLQEYRLQTCRTLLVSQDGIIASSLHNMSRWEICRFTFFIGWLGLIQVWNLLS